MASPVQSKQARELNLEELDVFTLPEREALTTCCGGGFLSVDIDIDVRVNLGGGGCHSGCY